MDHDLFQRFPRISDLERRAKRRIPFFSWEYLSSGTGAEQSLDRNLTQFANVRLTPQFMKGKFEPKTATTLFGREYAAPFGIAPVGLTGLMWPGTELILARTAAKYHIPLSLSTVATEMPETVGGLANGMGWFQLYPPRDPEIRRDILSRAKESGFETLLVTVDIPAASRRERQTRAEVSVPPRKTWRTYLRAAIRPTWSMATLSHGLPRFRMLEKYASTSDMLQMAQYVGHELGGTLSWSYLEEVRKEWDGPMLIKGVLDSDDARRAVDIGLDGVVVSNHGARQFDGAPASIEVLPRIADAVGADTTIVFDSGVRSGLDICRALALGADFVLLGRAFIFGVAALGERGGDHVYELLLADLQSNMSNLGCETIPELHERLFKEAV